MMNFIILVILPLLIGGIMLAAFIYCVDYLWKFSVDYATKLFQKYFAEPQK